jgi:hypothetical protein
VTDEGEYDSRGRYYPHGFPGHRERWKPKGPVPPLPSDRVKYLDPGRRILGKTVRAKVGDDYVYGIITDYMDCHPALVPRKRRPGQPKREPPKWLEGATCGPGWPKIRVQLTDGRALGDLHLEEEDWYPLTGGWQVKWEEGMWY